MAVVGIEQVCKLSNFVLRMDQMHLGIVERELYLLAKAFMVFAFGFSHGAERVEGWE